jgi:hypothetical protein
MAATDVALPTPPSEVDRHQGPDGLVLPSKSPPDMALTRLAVRGDLSALRVLRVLHALPLPRAASPRPCQLRWARWQSARSFDSHSLNAYGSCPQRRSNLRHPMGDSFLWL